MAPKIGILLATLFSWYGDVSAQTFGDLPQAAHYQDGVFTSPNTVVRQVFDVRSIMTISWESIFASVDINLIYDEQWNDAFSIISKPRRYPP